MSALSGPVHYGTAQVQAHTVRGAHSPVAQQRQSNLRLAGSAPA